MGTDIVDTDSQMKLNSDSDVLEIVCQLQESKRSESLIILQAFLRFSHRQEYPHDFIQSQLNVIKNFTLSSLSSPTPALFDLLKQFVPESELISAFNDIRKSMVESLIKQFRKDNQKQKWGGNGEKILVLGSLIQRSLKLYHSNEDLIINTTSEWYTIVLDLFNPLMEDLNQYLKHKLEKQKQQYLSLSYLIKPLSTLCEQFNKYDQRKNLISVNQYFVNSVRAVLQQRIDLILNKNIFDRFDSFDKLEEYKCPIRNSVFYVYPDIRKLLIFLNDAKISKISLKLNQTSNDQFFEQLLAKASDICRNYPSSTSLEHCICLISCLSSIDIFFDSEKFQYFLHNFCHFFLTYWQMTILHDCDANDWLNTKPYSENMRYSVFIDTLFHHFNRFHAYIKQYCSSLLLKIISYTLLELMTFIHHRYASIKVSYARQQQYGMDLLAFLVHSSQYAHYFINRDKSIGEHTLFSDDETESKFIDYGNAILASAILVTCPCDILHEQLNIIIQRPSKTPSKLNWLAVIRPDWFDINYEIKPHVRTFLVMQNIVETRHNYSPIYELVVLVLKNPELDSYRPTIVHLVMRHKQWELIHLFVKHEQDWSFVLNQSVKLPKWLSLMMEYAKDFFIKCCSLCTNEKEIEWRSKIQQRLGSEQNFDEKLNFLKSLQHYIVNMPLCLYYLLRAINQSQPQFNKRFIFARLLYNYMVDQKFNHSSIYYSYLTGYQNNHLHTLEKLLDRKSWLFRFPIDDFDDDETSLQRISDRFETLNENFEKIQSRLGVKTLDEYYSTLQSYSQLFTSQQRQIATSTENLNVKTKSDDHIFTDITIHESKHSLNTSVKTFKIDCSLVNRIELDWPTLFAHLIVRLKSNIIYHLVTLRFEFQSQAAPLLKDVERSAVKNLTELLVPILKDKQ